MATPQNGAVAVRLNGKILAIKGSITYSVGGKTREPVEGPTGLVAFAVKTQPAFVEVVSVDSSDVDLAALQELKDQTISLGLENGKTVVVYEASTVGLIEVTTDEGEFTVRFVGESAKEI